MKTLMNRFQRAPALYALLPMLLSAFLDFAFGLSYIFRYLTAASQVLNANIIAEALFVGCFRGILILVCFFLCFWAISTGRSGIRFMILPAFLAACHLAIVQQKTGSLIDYVQLFAAVLCLGAIIFTTVTATNKKPAKGSTDVSKKQPL